MPKVTFKKDRCKGCELCLIACPKNIIIMDKQLNAMGFYPATVEEQDKCTACTACAKVCPDVVIEIDKGEK